MKEWKFHWKTNTLFEFLIWKHFDTCFTKLKHFEWNWTVQAILTVIFLMRFELYFHHSRILNFRETATEDLFLFLMKILRYCWVVEKRWGLEFIFLPKARKPSLLIFFLLPAARGTSGPTTTSLISWSLQNWASAAWLLTETAVNDRKVW